MILDGLVRVADRSITVMYKHAMEDREPDRWFLSDDSKLWRVVVIQNYKAAVQLRYSAAAGICNSCFIS
jgi:hypothetical protein